jgi:outer membrane protein
MNQCKREKRRLAVFFLFVVVFLSSPGTAQPADTPVAATQGTASAASGLTMDEVVRIALENHSSIKSAQYQINAQDAVLHQQMAAYYPTITLNSLYTTASTGVGGRGLDSFTAASNVTMTLYNFGRREGSVQSARDTLGATQYGYKVTANNIVLAVKQAYLGVLQANALLRVSEDTVKDREVTLRQTQGFYDVGTKPRSDLTQAEANLYLAQTNLIVARNAVDVAWANLRNAMGVDDYPKGPLAEELAVTPFSMSLQEAKQTAFSSRPELLQFASLLKAQDELIAVARRNHLPELAFNSSYGGRARTFETTSRDWIVGLSLTIPIFNGFQTTYQVQQALSTYYSIKEQERVERQQVALQVEQSYLTLFAAQDAIRSTEAGVKAAKENLDLHVGRYEVGYAPIVEVTDAQTTYTTAQTNYVNALIAQKLAMVQLVNAMGGQ